MEDKIELIRALVRPFITLWFAVTWVLTDMSTTPTSMHTWLTVGCVVWYFGDRFYFKNKTS